MPINTREKMVDACIEKRKQGMDLSKIRQELKNAEVDDDEIKVTMQLVDNYDRRAAEHKAISTRKKEFFFVGTILFVAGVSFTFAYSNSGIVVLFYGAILTGLSLMGYGYTGFAKKL